MASPKDPVRALQEAVRASLSAQADATRAEGMRAYMKSAMPCYGVATTPLRKTCKELFASHPLADKDTWRCAVLTIWREAVFREERYVAIELSGARVYKTHQATDLLPMYEEMIVTGAWWDFVDVIAIHRLGPLLLVSPEPMKKAMLEWSRSADLWKRRTSVICQVAAKQKTDLDLLHRAIEANMADKDFFLRKAIGWALRSYAYIDASFVAGYVRDNHARLSPLSRREALKNIGDTPPE